MLGFAGLETSEARSGLDQALRRNAPIDARLLARAHLARARLHLRGGQWRAARGDYQAALAATREPAVQAAAWGGLGHGARERGGRIAAKRAYQRALGYFQSRADRSGKARILASLGGMLYEQGQLHAARELHDQALALYRAAADTRGAAVVLHNRGLISQEQ